MEQFLTELSIETQGEGFIDITSELNDWIKDNNINKGIVVITSKHTSCSLIINENADPRVLEDLSSYMKAIVPEIGVKSIMNNSGIKKYLHSEEGLDDMPAHIRTMLTSSSLTISIKDSRLDLGTWQAIYLWEHRYANNIRKINLHSICEINPGNTKIENENFQAVITKTNANKINKIILKNQEDLKSGAEGTISDTKMDLLIDRIHDITTQNEENTLR